MPDTEPVNNPSAKADIRFDISQTTVVAGTPVVLSWKVTNAERVFVNGHDMPYEGELEEIIEEDKKFKLETNGKGLFAGQKQVIAIKVPAPLISSIELGPDVIRENKPAILRFALQYCSHWKLEATYLGNRKTETVATGNNRTWKPDWHEEVEVFLKAACSLVLTGFNGKRETTSKPYYLDIAKPVINDFTADKLIIAADGTVRLNWKAADYHKLLIHPGNNDVSTDHSFDFKPAGNHDVNVVLTAYGDFGQHDSRSLQIRVAWLGNHTTSNNGNADNPEFYLGWDSAYLEHATLNPGGLSVPVTATRFAIPARDVTGDHYLQGPTVSGEIVNYPFKLYAAEILFFEASRASAIIGTRLYLRWRVINARKVTFNHGIGNQTGQEEVSVTMQKGMENITITVWGDLNVVTQSVYIPLLKGPEITRISIPLPELKMQFTFHRVFVPPRTGLLFTSSLSRQYKKIHPMLKMMLLPSTAAGQLLTRRKWRLPVEKVSRLAQFTLQQVIDLLAEFKALLQKIKMWRI